MSPADPVVIRDAAATVRATPTVRASLDLGPAAFDLWRDAAILVACEFVRALDAGELVRVKGLEWNLDDRNGPKMWVAVTPFWVFKVLSRHWWIEGESEPRTCDSIEDGKAKAEQWYRSRLAAALEPYG